MGLVQRAIEREGVPTISVTMLPDATRRVGVPRAVAVGFPLGHPLGYPGNGLVQRRILSLMLRYAREIAEPGRVVAPGLGGKG